MPEKQIFEDFSKITRSTKIDHGLKSTGRFPPVMDCLPNQTC